MFQEFENEINNFMTEKVKDVAGAAEEIFNTAGKIKEQETKIKSLTKSKKEMRRKISDLEKQVAKYENTVQDDGFEKVRMQYEEPDEESRIYTLIQNLTSDVNKVLEKSKSQDASVSREIFLKNDNDLKNNISKLTAENNDLKLQIGDYAKTNKLSLETIKNLELEIKNKNIYLVDIDNIRFYWKINFWSCLLFILIWCGTNMIGEH